MGHRCSSIQCQVRRAHRYRIADRQPETRVRLQSHIVVARRDPGRPGDRPHRQSIAVVEADAPAGVPRQRVHVIARVLQRVRTGSQHHQTLGHNRPRLRHRAAGAQAHHSAHRHRRHREARVPHHRQVPQPRRYRRKARRPRVLADRQILHVPVVGKGDRVPEGIAKVQQDIRDAARDRKVARAGHIQHSALGNAPPSRHIQRSIYNRGTQRNTVRNLHRHIISTSNFDSSKIIGCISE